MFRQLPLLPVIVFTFLSCVVQSADEPPPIQTIVGTVEMLGKDSLTIKTSDGRSEEMVTLKLTGTSRFSMLSTEKRGANVVFIQEKAEATNLLVTQTIAAIYAINAGDCILLSAVMFAGDDEWKPPKNPDADLIYAQISADVKGKRYKTALAKHVWLHYEGMKKDPRRLSFALGNWHELGEVYPPALRKLEEARNESQKNVIEGRDVLKSFEEMARINECLKKQSLTKDVFEALDSKDTELAKEVFSAALPALVKVKAYTLCAKYVEPQTDFKRMLEKREVIKLLGEGFFKGFSDENFANEVTTLVAILAVSDRKAEAKEIAIAAKKELDDMEFHEELDKALKGIFPPRR
ncbi:MAG: hypothetical protein U0941_26060 [Planctomycetaceae bacterium]